jgi:hypothetical protein
MFCTAAATETENLDYGLREIKSFGQFSGQLFEIDEITIDVLHFFAARADKMMVRFGVSVHAESGGMRRDFTQHAVLHEETQVVVDGGKRNRRNALANGCINLLRRAMTVRGDDCFIDDLALMRGREAALPGHFPKLVVSQPHDRGGEFLLNDNYYKTEVRRKVKCGRPISSKKSVLLPVAHKEVQMNRLNECGRGRKERRIL